MLIYKRISLWLRARRGLRGPNGALAICALLIMGPLLTGCSREGLAQAATATTSTSATPVVTPATSATPPPTTAQSAPTGTPGGPATPRPTPSGAPPTPVDVLNVFRFFVSPEMLAKRDSLQLDDDADSEMLFTISEPADVVTQETNSVLRVIDYDPKYREWNQIWQSDVVTGTASPLPAANRADGYNGGRLLGTNDSVLLMRANTIDGHAHLYIWRWDAATHAGEHLKMVPAGGGAERVTDFEGDLDVTVADLDNDGVYEVIADDLAGTQTWKWDGSKYAPEAKRP